jgi:hypothetical protein
MSKAELLFLARTVFMMRTIEISGLINVATARAAVRDVAEGLGFPASETRSFLNIVSELCLYAIESGRPGLITVNQLCRPDRAGICLVVRIPNPSSTQGNSLPRSPNAVPSVGMKSLCDQFEITESAGETIIHAVKWRSLQLSGVDTVRELCGS